MSENSNTGQMLLDIAELKRQIERRDARILELEGLSHPAPAVAAEQDDRGPEWEAFKRKHALAMMARHPNAYTRWGLANAPRWLLVYEDADRGIGLFDEREEAMLQFAKSEQAGWNCTLFVTETRTTPPAAVAVPDAVGAMVDRFLGWKLPQDFMPDAGISFTPPSNPEWQPTGTNLLNANQAKAMFEYCLAGSALIASAPAVPESQYAALVEQYQKLQGEKEYCCCGECPERAPSAPAVAVPEGMPVLTIGERKALERFVECCDDSDSDGNDVDRLMMRRLAGIGVVRCLGGQWELTEFGSYILAAPASPAATGWVPVPTEHIATLSRLAVHAKDCLSSNPLPTGHGNWHCTCGLDSIVLDGEYTPAPSVDGEG